MDGSRIGDRTNERCPPLYTSTVSIRVLSLSLLHSSMPTRPCNRSHRARLIFSSNETNFAGRWRSNFHPYLRPRQFFRLYATSLPLSLSLSLSSSLLFPKVIRNGHEKDVKGWLLSVAIVASVISRLYLEPRLE